MSGLVAGMWGSSVSEAPPPVTPTRSLPPRRGGPVGSVAALDAPPHAASTGVAAVARAPSRKDLLCRGVSNNVEELPVRAGAVSTDTASRVVGDRLLVAPQPRCHVVRERRGAGVRDVQSE